jgi:succinate-semialdehyde dehydrogenase/glutarate-semialdehyde dehydrogenase
LSFNRVVVNKLSTSKDEYIKNRPNKCWNSVTSEEKPMNLENMLIDGKWVAATSHRSFAVYNPANNSIVGKAPDGSADDAFLAISAADTAFADWAETPAAKRAGILRKAGDLLISRQESISKLITLEAGKLLRASRKEISAAAEFIYWYAEEGRRSYGQWIPDPLPDRRLLTIRQPIGVVGVITPWNYPAYMIARTAAAALAAGCTVVVRPSKQTALTGLAVARAFADAGIPPGVFNLITGDSKAIARVFLDDNRVKKISFTGSVEVGKQLMTGAASSVKRVALELGGNAPFIVLSDADYNKTIEGLISAKFGDAGQRCIAPNRVFVHASLLETFLERVSDKIAKLKVGRGLDPETDIGPLINRSAVEKVESYVRDAVDHGARVVIGGYRLTEGALASGSFYAPTVLADVTSDMRIAREETFGPVVPIIAFEEDEGIIERANDTPYGLAAYLYTHDLTKAIRIAERLEFGVIGINNTRIATVEGPFGGFKQSGIGREGGHEGLASFLETKEIAFRV